MTALESISTPPPLPLDAPGSSHALRVMAIVEDADRPTVATLCGLQAAGCKVSAIAPGHTGIRDQLTRSGVRLMGFQIRQRLDFDGIRLLRKELEQGGYDILHAFNNRGLQNGIIAARGLPVRLIAYRGRVGNISFFDPFCWIRHLNPRIDRIVCVSDAVRDYFLQMRPAAFRAGPDRYVRIHKGHDLDWYRSAPADLRQFGIPVGAFVVACVANYRPHKGIDVLISSLRLLPQGLPVHLLLIGNMDSPQLDRLINSLPNPQRVHRIGYRSDAPIIAAASDVVALASTIPEGLPRSIIEAMAYERACIVSNLGGSAELVVDDESGLHVPAGDPEAIADAIRRLHADPALRRNLGINAKKRIREAFNIEQTIAATLDLYRSVVSRNTG